MLKLCIKFYEFKITNQLQKRLDLLKQLKTIFLFIIIIGTILFITLIYKSKDFKNNPLKSKVKDKIEKKNLELQSLASLRLNINAKFPIIISDKLPNKLYGLTSIDKNKNIFIYLNKKRFQEESEYMIESVLPHEYAHAIMFYGGDYTKQNGGHTKKWQKICQILDGKKCERFVNMHDIVIEKTTLF